MRRIGEIGKRFAGDEESAKQYLGTARVLLGRMKSYLAGAYGSRQWRLPDGTVILTKSLPTGDYVNIFRPEFGEEEGVEFHIHGILATRSAQTKFLRTKTGLFAPAFNVRVVPDKEAGTLQWKGQAERDMVWIKGPQSRYFVRDRNFDLGTTVYTHENRAISFDGGGAVYGAAIYRGEDGSGYVVAHSTDGIEMRFSIRKEGVWEEIGTPIPMPGADRINTVCMFHPLGNKAVFVSKYGAIVEVTLTYTGFSFTETDRALYRQAGFSPVGGSSSTSTVVNITETTSSVVIEEFADNSAFRMERQRLDPDDLDVVLEAASLSDWEQVIAAEYSPAGSLITASLRYSGPAQKLVASGEFFVGGSTINQAAQQFNYFGPDIGDANQVGSGTPFVVPGFSHRDWISSYLEDQAFVVAGFINPPIAADSTVAGPQYSSSSTTTSTRSPFGLSRSLVSQKVVDQTASQITTPADFEVRIVFSTGDASILLYKLFVDVDITETYFYQEDVDYSYNESPNGDGTSDYAYSYERSDSTTFNVDGSASLIQYEGTIRFLDVRTQSAVIGAIRKDESVSLTGAYVNSYSTGALTGVSEDKTSSGPDPDGLEGPGTTHSPVPDRVTLAMTYDGLATRTIRREDRVIQDGVEVKSASRVVRDYNRTLSSPGGSSTTTYISQVIDVIRRNNPPESYSDSDTVLSTEFPEGANRHFNALVFHTFGYAVAASTSLTLSKYNYFFSDSPFTALFADHGPMNILYLDEEFRSVPDVFGNDVVYFPIESV